MYPNTKGHLLWQMPGYGLLIVLMAAKLSYFFVRGNKKCIQLVPPNIIQVTWLVSQRFRMQMGQCSKATCIRCELWKNRKPACRAMAIRCVKTTGCNRTSVFHAPWSNRFSVSQALTSDRLSDSTSHAFLLLNLCNDTC